MLTTVFVRVIKDRRLGFVALASGASYVFIWLLVTGALFYFPKGIPGVLRYEFGVPYFSITWKAINYIPTEYVTFSITYGALSFLLITSSLLGLSLSLFLFNRRIHGQCGLPTMGLLGVLPAMFTTFSCCGGGLLLLVLGSVGFNTLTMNSEYFQYFSTAVLAVGTFMLAKRAYRQMRIVNFQC